MTVGGAGGRGLKKKRLTQTSSVNTKWMKVIILFNKGGSQIGFI